MDNSDATGMCRAHRPLDTSHQSSSVRHSLRSAPWLSRARGLFLALCIALALSPRVHADDIEYVYDEAGRLVQAANHTSGEAVVYQYDAVGNIVSQVGTPLTTLSISYFSPAKGPVGASVTISGTGFSATPGDNTVRFNGTSATVVTATQTQLVAAVPPGATSGPISVQVGAASVATATAFQVTAAADGPIVSALTPSIGTAGTAVVISGANFEPLPLDNRIRFGNSSASVIGAATPTALNTVVPSGTGSGRVRVTTPRGVAISPMDFIVVPSGYSAGSIGSTGRISVDAAPTSISLSTANRISVQLFDASAADLLTVGVSSISLASCTIKIFRPDGSLLTSGTVNASGQGVQLPKLTVTGTYTIVVDPGANTGSIALSVRKPLQASATLDGGSTNVTLTPNGRRAIISFSGGQGTYIGLILSGVTLSAGTVSLISPDGSILVSGSFGVSGMTLTPQLPASGTYRVLIDPTGSIGGSLDVALTSSASPTLAIDQPGYDVSLSSAAAVSVTFRGTANQYLSLGITENSSGVSGANVTVLKPDGTQLTTGTFTATACGGGLGCSGYYGSAVVSMGPLPSGGTYTALIQRTTGSGSGTVTLTLSSPVTGTLTGGTPSTIQATRYGQGMQLTFAGVAGQHFALALQETSSSIPGATLKVLRPDGSQLTSGTFTATSCSGFGCSGNSGSALLNMGPLSSSGAYTVIIQQTTGGSGTLTLTLSNPVTQTLTAGTPSGISLPLLGQGMDVSFSGSAGQYLALGISESQYDGIAGMTALVLRPDGTLLTTGVFTATLCSGFGCNGYSGTAVVNMGPLPVAGTYRVILQQASAGSGTLTLTLSSPTTGTLSDGVPSSVAASFLGQSMQLTFAGSAGQYWSLGISEADSEIAGANVTVVKPDGSILTTGTFTPTFCSGFGCNGYSGTGVVNMGPLPATGTYTILLQQSGGGTGSLSLTLSSPMTASLSSGTPATVSAPLVGQAMRLTFSGAAGEYAALGLEESAYDGIAGETITVLKPDGGQLATGTFTGTLCTGFGCNGYYGTALVNMGPLPAAGTYTVLLQQATGGTGSLTLSLSNPATAALAPSTPTSVFASLLGQPIQLTFAGSADAYVTLQTSESYGSHISGATIEVKNPDGTQLATGDFTAATCSGCDGYSGSSVMNLPPLPVAGTYTVMLQQKSAGTGTLTFTAEGVTSPGTSSWNISTSTSGQTASFTFDSAAGQNLSLAISSYVLAPSSVTYGTVSISKPDGVQLTWAYCYQSNGGCVLSLRNLPQTGTYTVTVQPGGSATQSFVATLSPDIVGTLTPGTPQSLNLTAIGQNALLSFTATTGQNMALNSGGISSTPANVSYYLYVYGPTGAQVASGSSPSGMTLNLANLTAGTYTVLVTPQKPATGSLQVTLQPGTGGTLTQGTTSSFNTPAPGQNAYFTFAATAGDNVSFTVSGLTFTPSSVTYGAVSISKPDGVQLAAAYCYQSDGGCVLSLRNLPQSGTYSVTFAPGGFATMSFSATYSADVVATLTAGTPAALSLALIGQCATLSFTATAGQTVAVTISSISSVPASKPYSLFAYNPSGTQIGSVQTATGATLNLPNLAAGMYTLRVVPVYPTTATMQVGY